MSVAASKNENVEMSVEPDNIVVEPDNIVVEPSNIVVEPSNIVVEPSNIVVEPSNIVVEPINIVVEPVNIVVEPTNDVVEPVNVVVEPTNDITTPLTKEEKALQREAEKAEKAKIREQKALQREAEKAEKAKIQEQKQKDRLKKIEDDANAKIALLKKKEEMDALLIAEKNKFNITPNDKGIIIAPIEKSKTFIEAFGADKLIEHFNKVSAKYLLENWDDYTDRFNTFDNIDPIDLLKSYDRKILFECYLKSSKNKDFVFVKYNKASLDKTSNIKKKYGRYFADKSLSLQTMPRAVRGTLCKGLWIDIDFKNCHPVILEQLCIYYGIKCEYLNKYNRNREDMLKEMMDKEGITRDDAKKYILKTLNGGYISINIDWWGALKNEFKQIAEKIAVRPEFDKIYKDCLGVKKENLNARVMNGVLCIYENLCLENLYNHLTNNDIIQGFKCCLSFDGLMVQDNQFNRHKITSNFLKDTSLYIKEQTGLYLELAIKDFDEYIEIPKDYDKDDADDIQSYYNVKNEFEKEHFKIRHPPMIASYKSNAYEMQSMKGFTDSYLDIVFVKFDENGKLKINQFVPTWLRDNTIRCYDYIDFKPPPLLCGEKEFNTWDGFKIAKEPLIETERDYYNEFYTYALNLINNKEVVDFIFARYAFRLQKPGLRTNVCVVLCGCEGDGKNRFLQVFYNIMEGYTTVLENAKLLFEKHATNEKDKLFILINEAGGNANFENADVLKSRITEPDILVNPKGIQSYTIKNLCDYDYTTNNQNVIKLTDDSFRRFLQVETTTYYSGNDVFFTDFVENIEKNPIALRQIYERLINLNINDIIPSGNFQKDKPTTAVEDEVKQQNRDKVLWFLEDFVKDNIYCYDGCVLNGNVLKITNDSLFKRWCIWCENSKVKIEYNKIQFGIKKSIVMKKNINKNGVKIMDIDTHSNTIIYIQELKEFFRKLHKIDFIDEED